MGPPHDRVDPADAFFKRWAGDARPQDLKAFLAAGPDRAPEPGDEVPARLGR